MGNMHSRTTTDTESVVCNTSTAESGILPESCTSITSRASEESVVSLAATNQSLESTSQENDSNNENSDTARNDTVDPCALNDFDNVQFSVLLVEGISIAEEERLKAEIIAQGKVPLVVYQKNFWRDYNRVRSGLGYVDSIGVYRPLLFE